MTAVATATEATEATWAPSPSAIKRLKRGSSNILIFPGVKGEKRSPIGMKGAVVARMENSGVNLVIFSAILESFRSVSLEDLGVATGMRESRSGGWLEGKVSRADVEHAWNQQNPTFPYHQHGWVWLLRFSRLKN